MGSLDAPVEVHLSTSTSLKIEGVRQENGVGVGHFQAKSPFTYFRHRRIRFNYLQSDTLNNLLFK